MTTPEGEIPRGFSLHPTREVASRTAGSVSHDKQPRKTVTPQASREEQGMLIGIS